jgi:copper transport protein
MRRLGLLLALGLCFTVGWVGLASEAWAHASLRNSDPDNGALLDQAPEEIRLAFTEPPDLSLTTISVVDRSGAPVPIGPVEGVAATNREIRVPIEDLPDGVYTVTWRTVSVTDGHLTSGAFSFGVGVAPEEVAPVEPGESTQAPAPTALAVAGRWALYVGLVVLFGAAIAGLIAFGPRSVSRAWLPGSAWALAAVGVVAMTLEERRVVGVSLGTLLDSDAGAAFIRLGIAVAIVGLAVTAVVLRPGRASSLVLAAAAGAAILVRTFGGHAGPSVLEASLQGAHTVAAGAWIGGLVWLVVGLRRGVEPERIRRFSNVAAVGLGVIVLTGFLRASNELGGLGWWLHLFDTDYGTALFAKLAVVAAIVALGAVNRYRNVRRYEELGKRPLVRTVSGELALAAGALAMTGLLTGLPPQGSEAARTPRPTQPLVIGGSDFATTTTVRLSISPGTVGPNTFVAEVTDFDTGEPVEARSVILTFSLPDRPEVRSRLDLERAGNGRWQADGTSLSLDGIWDVDVLVEAATGSVEVPLHVSTRPPEQRIEVSRATGQPDLYTIHLSGGASIQAYVDPGEPGRTNQVHVTVFDAEGAELPLHHAALQIAPPDRDPFAPELMQLSPGHFVANVDIASGTSSFRIVALTADGRDLVASFEQTFGVEP